MGNYERKPGWGFIRYAILSLFECLFFSVLSGIICFIPAIQANMAYKSGNMIRFRQQRELTDYCILVSVVIFILILILEAIVTRL